MDDLAPTQPMDAFDPLEAAASRVLSRRQRGEDDRLDEEREALSEAERSRLDELLDGADLARAFLPRQVGEGVVLSERYQIRRELGAGGMGKVFVAFDLRLKREVAVKVLSAIDVNGLDVGALFTRESEVLARLSHPGIVPVYEAGQDGDISYIVMEYVTGVSGAELLERLRGDAGPVEPPANGDDILRAIDLPRPDGGVEIVDPRSYVRSVARIFVELARTMEAAHGQGVVHRDLKPGNVMLRGDGRPVILDFGLAGRLDQDQGELTRRLFGSACYIAPEQAERGMAGADPRCDVYALGVMLYEFLTLDRAFQGDELTRVLQAIVSGDFVPPRRRNRAIPVDLEAVVLKAMELRPRDRMPSARAMREDLEAWLDGRPLVHSRGGGLARAARTARYAVRRHRVAAVVLVALAVGLMAGPLMLDRGPELPDLRAFAIDDAGTVHYRDEAPFLGPGDWIGLEVRVDAPTWLYATSVSGYSDDQRAYLSATFPRVVDDAAGGAGAVADESGRVLLPAGLHRVLLARVGPDDDTEVEGFEAWLRPGRDAALEHMLAQVWQFGEPLGRVGRIRLMNSLAAATRGGLERDLDPAELAVVRRALELDETGDDPTHERVLFPVRR